MKVEIESVTCRVDRFYNASPAVNVSLIGMHEGKTYDSLRKFFSSSQYYESHGVCDKLNYSFVIQCFFPLLSNRLTDAWPGPPTNSSFLNSIIFSDSQIKFYDFSWCFNNIKKCLYFPDLEIIKYFVETEI